MLSSFLELSNVWEKKTFYFTNLPNKGDFFIVGNMVEVLSRPVEKHKGPELMRQDPKRAFSGHVIANIQKDIVRKRTFTALDNAVVDGFKLESKTIVKSLELLSATPIHANRATVHANEIFRKGWIPSPPKTGDGYHRKQLRRAALNTLLTLCESEKSRIRKNHQNNQLPDDELRSLLEPIEGTRLLTLSEVNPKKYQAIVTGISKKQQAQSWKRYGNT